MTREEFEGIAEWWQLKEAMDEEYYCDDMEGDLYETECDLVLAGLVGAICDNCQDINDTYRILDAFNQIDQRADVWTISNGFTTIHNYYEEDFSEIKEAFGEWMEENRLFDDEETEETDAFSEEYPQTGVSTTETAAPDDMAQPDIPLQTLMFCS